MHAQVDGVGTLEFPDGTDPSVIQSTVQKIIANKGGGGAATGKTDKPAMPTWRDKIKEGVKDYGRLVAAPIEAGASLASSAIAAPVAGLAGIAQGVKNVVSGDPTNMSAGDRVAQVQSGMTYQPRTEGGQATVEAATGPLRALAEGADWAGGKAAQGATALGASPEVAGVVGAGVNTALQAAPSALLPELAGKGPLGARIAARGKPPAPRIEPTISADPNAPKPALQTPPRQSAEQRAESYVRDRVGVDWSGLSQGLKDTITAIAQDAGSLDKLDPQQVARKARLDAAGIKGTRGQVERNLSQLTKEENLVKSDAGGEIRNIKADQDTHLHGLVDRLRQETGAKAETRGQVGASVQNEALRSKARASKKNYDALYETARKTEPEATVRAEPLYKFLSENPSVQHVGWLGDWLKKAKVEIPNMEGSPSEILDQSRGQELNLRGVKLEELDDLRKRALRANKPGSPDAHYAGEVIKAIDTAFDDIPAAATNWKAARDAFRKHQVEYKDTGIIKKLGTDKSVTDRRVALEDTLDTVVRGSSEDIGKIKTSLLEGHLNEKTKAAGEQAWKDIQGGVLDKLKEAATGKREIGNEQGVTQFNSSFRNLFNELDKDGKIDALFSPEQAKRLRDINKLVEDLRTTPSGRVAGSDTVPRLVSMLDKVGEIPGIGGIAKTIAGGVTKLYKAGEEGRQVRRAQSDPLQEAVKGAKKNVRTKRNKKAAAAAAPIVPASIGELQKRDQNQ